MFDGDFKYIKINTIIYGCFEVTPDELSVIRIEKLSEVMLKKKLNHTLPISMVVVIFTVI